VKVYGISLDGVAAQKTFHTAQTLNFPLLSDPDGSVAARFGTVAPGGAYTQRHTFVLDPEGAVRHVDRGVKAASHGTDLIAVVEGLVKKPVAR
jgi:peroxiredoxin Q/BCP